jgi:predicted enzyme related to lactoylglutathione lyase
MRIARIAILIAATYSVLISPLAAAGYAVGPQYDTTHVYVAPADFDRFVASFVATFGGTTSKQGVFQVTPTPSQTMSQLALTPAGTISIFGFKTPIPHPFGSERTGYLVTDMDAAVKAARNAGADVVVAPFPDPIGRDAVVSWPGSVNMQLYWHTTPPAYTPLTTIPENRIYISPGRADAFIKDFLAFAGGKVVSDDTKAPGAEIGRPSESFRRVRLQTPFGKLALIVTDGHLPFPYGHEMTGYEVSDLQATLDKATKAGAVVLAPAAKSGQRTAAIVQFPGGYIAEIHSESVNSLTAGPAATP